MPLDGGDFSDLGYRQRLADLSVALRGQRFPDQFEWHFDVVVMPIAIYADRVQGVERDVCGTAGCALGLAYTLMAPKNGIGLSDPNAVAAWASQYFNLPEETFYAIFYGGPENSTYSGMPRADVTPLMVAKVIDRYLATGSTKPKRRCLARVEA